MEAGLVFHLKSQRPEQVLHLLILSIEFNKTLLAITFLSLGFLQQVDSNNGAFRMFY